MWGRTSSERGSLSGGRGQGERLAERRRTRRRISLGIGIVFLCVLIGAGIYGLRQSAVRISHVAVFGTDAPLAEYAMNAMRDYYLGLIPRDSTFFYPAERIRADILASNLDFAAVSLSRDGFNGLSIKVDTRVAIARWCGLAPTPGVDEYCYVFDANGFIFAAAATSTRTVNSFAVYAPPKVETLEPLGETVAYAEKLPSVFDFARELAPLGSPVIRIVIKDGEVSDYLSSGTRITYLFGDEQNAYTALVSAKANMDLADGSVDYVDLRFGGKVYLKKKQ